MPASLRTPVVFIVFNRPETTAAVFAEIAKVRPAKLFLVADGPRNQEEAERCARAREIAQSVDWPCDVRTNFAEENMGCGRRVSSGLNWVFEQCEEAIILEDDCVPDPSFFPYCEQMLERYRDAPRVMNVSALSVPPYEDGEPDGYRFSRYTFIWGWATWRRAWRSYDITMHKWPGLRSTKWLAKLLCDPDAEEYWKSIFDLAHSGRVDTWDFMWVFSCWANDGIAIVPNRNVVTNIGFGPDATHTLDAHHKFSCRPSAPLNFPLRHPPEVSIDHEADRRAFQFAYEYRRPTLLQRTRTYVSRLPVIGWLGSAALALGRRALRQRP